MLTVAIPKRNKLQNIIVLTPKDGISMWLMDCGLIFSQRIFRKRWSGIRSRILRGEAEKKTVLIWRSIV